MRDLGVLNAEHSDWLWEFDGTSDDHRRLMAALTAVTTDDEAPAD